MFQWEKSIKSMDVPVDEVVHLYRSMRDVQLALPGHSAQEATAYLCQHKTSQGIGTIAAFHLHKSKLLAFYVDAPVVVAADRADSVLDQALMFVESMGFLMNDLDIHLLGAADRELLWSSLPLQNGIQEGEQSVPPKPVAAPPQAKTVAPLTLTPPGEKAPVAKVSLPEGKQGPGGFAVDQTQRQVPPVEAAPGEQANVDDLLAAVEELRNRRSGARSRKKPPSPEELKRRRQELRENIGRVLASL